MINNKKIALFLFIAISAFLALLTDYHFAGSKTHFLDQDEVQNRLKSNENIAINFINSLSGQKQEFILPSKTKEIKLLATNNVDILLYENDSLVFWTNPVKVVLDSLDNFKSKAKFVYQNNNIYEVIRNNISQNNKAIIVIQVLPEMDPNIVISDSKISKSDIKLVSLDKSSVLYVKSKIQVNNIWHDYLRLLLFLICCIFLLSSIKIVSTRLIGIIPEWAVSAFILFGVFGLRLVYSLADLSSYFNGLSIFSKTLNSAYLGSSIGDFLLNAVIFLWVVIYWFNTFKAVSYDHLNTRIRWVLGISIYFAIVLGIIMITGIIKSTILESNIYFDFENIFNLNTNSFILILGLMIVFITLFLFSQRLMFTIDLLKLNNVQRITSILISLALMYLFLITVPIVGINVKFFLFILMYLLLLDFYSDSTTTDFTWLMIWLIIFSSFSAALLFTYNQGKEQIQLKQYSKLLSNPRDKVLEENCKKFLDETNRTTKSIENFRLSSNTYISKFYNPKDTFAGKKVSIWYPTEIENLTWGIMRENGNTVYRFWPSKTSKPIYLETKDYIEFSLHSGIQPKDGNTYKGMINLDKYGFALFYKNRLIFQNANFQNNEIDKSNAKYKNLINQKFMVIGNRNLDPTGREVEINKIGGGFIKLLSLFSYLFVLLAMTFLTFIALNTFFKFIPGIYIFENQSDITLRNRIQIAIISMIVVSFFAIGIITITYFNFSNKKALSESLIRKITNISNKLSQDLSVSKSVDLKNYSADLESEIIVYDKAGLITNSFPANIETIDPSLKYLVKHPILFNYSNGLQNEESFFQNFDHSYLIHTIRGQNSMISGYIALPYSKTDITTNPQIADFIGALINTYVFLLLIASALALAVGRSITKPLFALGDKLNRLKLGKQNEPITWSKNDEIGFLVKEYNQMIIKLEQSANLLAKSEREEAWREMARQVAHEIKNPLTPMKLNIQYLLHSYNADIETRDQRIKNICGVLIQQIENLSAIAGTFGEFAHEPKPNNEELHLNSIITGIFELFEKTGNDKLSFTKKITDEDIFVYADKSHLIRIINNLLKNAIQAIPNDHSGKIFVSLYKDIDKAIIQIKDNGHGIDDSKKEKIFIPNFTTKSSGSGLGLPICKKLIESMDGEIFFETEVNKGTSFFVKLPIKI